MRKQLLIMTILFFSLVFTLSFSHASGEDYVCCQKSIGGYCANMLPSDAASKCLSPSVQQTSCSQIPSCQLGTCVTTTGYCTPEKTSKIVCESPLADGGKGGTWFAESRENLPQCQVGCCILGSDWSTISKNECITQYADAGINTNDMIFKLGVTDDESCKALTSSNKEGACVYPGEAGLQACKRTNSDNCKSTGGKFYEGLLCTAKNLGTKCVKKEETMCDEKDTYYVDSCGNKANIVDKVNENNPSYWEKILDEADCQYDPRNPGKCGDCDYTSSYSEGSKCGIDNGKAQCLPLGCNYEGKEYSHGESWCVSEGGPTDFKIEKDLITNELVGDARAKLENAENINAPGARYYKMSCWEGKIYQENCMDYRNQVCVDKTLSDGTRGADCRINEWRDCFNLTSKTECESVDYDCKWIGGEKYLWGYRFDGEIYKWDGSNKDQEEERIEYQGSCVPLYAPGFDFWEEKSENTSSVCDLGSVTEAATFETGIFIQRDEFEDWSTKSAASQCFDGACYAIPDFGLEDSLKISIDQTLNIFKGGGAPSGKKIKDLYLSRRRGYYCEGATGKVTGENGASCADHASKRKDIPLFLNHGLWVDYIQTRANALGDCGFKENINEMYGQEISEKLGVQFQILNQQGEVKDNKSESKVIYSGDRRLTEESNYRRSTLFATKKLIPFYWREYPWWKNLHKGETPNTGMTEEPKE